MPNLNISTFDDLLRAAREQPEPQRLLFVFAGAELPEDSTPEQRRRFAAGAGGALIPLMYVDKTPEELGTFSEKSRARWGPSGRSSSSRVWPGRVAALRPVKAPRRRCEAWSNPSRPGRTDRSFRSTGAGGLSCFNEVLRVDSATVTGMR
jgi:hypothetical protein